MTNRQAYDAERKDYLVETETLPLMIVRQKTKQEMRTTVDGMVGLKGLTFSTLEEAGGEDIVKARIKSVRERLFGRPDYSQAFNQ